MPLLNSAVSGQSLGAEQNGSHQQETVHHLLHLARPGPANSEETEPLRKQEQNGSPKDRASQVPRPSHKEHDPQQDNQGDSEGRRVYDPVEGRV